MGKKRRFWLEFNVFWGNVGNLFCCGIEFIIIPERNSINRIFSPSILLMKYNVAGVSQI